MKKEKVEKEFIRLKPKLVQIGFCIKNRKEELALTKEGVFAMGVLMAMFALTKKENINILENIVFRTKMNQYFSHEVEK